MPHLDQSNLDTRLQCAHARDAGKVLQVVKIVIQRIGTVEDRRKEIVSIE
jgi:hypothetical protein